MEATETKIIGKYRIDIIPDEDPLDPRGWDNLGEMICFHRRYSLGDKHNYSDPDELNDYLRKDKKKIGVILPLYLYDHSGLTMSTSPFSCPWDSGQVGVIFITKEKMRKEYSKIRVSKQLIARMTGYLKNEVEEYDQYLRGDCYGFRITDTETDEEVENSWGYYGEEWCMKEAESMVKAIIKCDQHGQLELKME